jgi:hypothetical protein
MSLTPTQRIICKVINALGMGGKYYQWKLKRVEAQGIVKYVVRWEPFGWNYKPAEKHCWLIFCERKILFRLKKQVE